MNVVVSKPNVKFFQIFINEPRCHYVKPHLQMQPPMIALNECMRIILYAPKLFYFTTGPQNNSLAELYLYSV